MSESTAGVPDRSAWQSLAGWIVIVVITFVLAAAVRRPPADDTYITIRYARNFLEGSGLVYNRGENTLGVSTPLWAFFLAGIQAVGGDPEVAAVWVGALSFLLAALLLIHELIPRSAESRWVYGLAFPLVFLHAFVSATAFSGMETGLYVLSVVLALLLVIRGRYATSAVLAGMATLLRPDGVVVFGIVMLCAGLKGLRKVPLPLVLYLIVIGPWIAFAWSEYGSPVPHSVAAKQVLHPASFWKNLLVVSETMTSSVVDFFLLIMGVSGMFLLTTRRQHWPFILWPALYVLGVLKSGIKPIFYWYFAPLWFFVLLLGYVGGVTFVMERKGTRIARWVAISIVLVSCGAGVWTLSSNDAAVGRDNVYRSIGRRYASRLNPSEVIYVCETGVLGFYFSENKILDASGINSPEAFSYRRAAREELRERGTPRANMSIETDWGVQLVREQKPDWIVSPRAWCQMRIIEEQAWFQQAYERLEVSYPEHLQGVGVYRRKD